MRHSFRAILLEHFSHRYTLADDDEEHLSFHPNALTTGALGTPALIESCQSLCASAYICARNALVVFGLFNPSGLFLHAQAYSATQPGNNSSITTPAALQDQKSEPQTSKPQQPEPPAETEEADEPATPVSDSVKADPKAAIGLAWQMLRSAVSSPKPQTRIDGVNALGTLKNFAETRSLLNKAIQDSDRDVRVAAVVAMGGMNVRTFIPTLRLALDDHTPEVTFASAVALWKLHDRSGENILYGVLGGEEKASSGFISSELHQANKDLHSPSTLAVLGAEQGAYAMLGPLGIGVDAYKMMHKGNTANSARVLAANLLADPPNQQAKQEFLGALHDKDYFVREASARALGGVQGQDVKTALLEAFGDPKTGVRFLAAASYIRVSAPPSSSTHSRQSKTASLQVKTKNNSNTTR
jgi:HEAT repeat protein